MAHHVHSEHAHRHDDACGHTRVRHGDHVDYLHGGHLHHEHQGHYDEHVLDVTAENPAECKPSSCGCGHAACEHELIRHGDHVDVVVDGRLHHLHDDHCDDHGPLRTL